MEARWATHVANWHAQVERVRKEIEEKKRLEVKVETKDVEMKVEEEKEPFVVNVYSNGVFSHKVYHSEEKKGETKVELPAPASIPMPVSPKPAQYSHSWDEAGPLPHTGTKRSASVVFDDESKRKQVCPEKAPLGLEESAKLDEKPIIVSNFHVVAVGPTAMEHESTAPPKVQCGDESFESSLIESDFDEKKH